jgi:hypothetical protein
MDKKDYEDAFTELVLLGERYGMMMVARSVVFSRMLLRCKKIFKDSLDMDIAPEVAGGKGPQCSFIGL